MQERSPRIAGDGDAWISARDDRRFKKRFRLDGDRLRNPPRGYAKDHSLIEDLKRKDFIAVADLTQREIVDKKFLPRVVKDFEAGDALMRFLCTALELRY